MKLKMLLLPAVLLLAAGCGEKSSQSDIDALKQELKEVKELQVTMARRLGLGELVRPEVIQMQQGIKIGADDARIAIMEFTDLHCPFCRRFNDDVYPELKTQFIDTGEVQFVARELPLMNIHPNAGMAAVALRCANAQGQYQPVKNALFANAAEFSATYLEKMGETFGFEQEAFDACLKDVNIHAAINESLAYARELGLNSTPVFLIGKKQGNSITDYQIITGAQSLDVFAKAIAELK